MSLGSQIKGVAHIGIRVHNLPRARKFYELLGFDFIVGPVGPEPVAIMRHPSGAEINLILNGASETGPNILMDVPVKHAGYTHMALLVKDAIATGKTLEAAGIPLSGKRPNDAGKTVAVFVRDPDRNVIELAEDEG
jgi:lactoylglutathione lyase